MAGMKMADKKSPMQAWGFFMQIRLNLLNHLLHLIAA